MTGIDENEKTAGDRQRYFETDLRAHSAGNGETTTFTNAPSSCRRGESLRERESLTKARVDRAEYGNHVAAFGCTEKTYEKRASLNPQYYQPLSHALHAPIAPTSNRSPQYPTYNSHAQNGTTASNQDQGDDEEEEDEEDVVEEELAGSRQDGASNAASPVTQSRQPGATLETAVNTSQSSTAQTQVQPQTPSQKPDSSAYAKRRPGRPKGSKTRRAAPDTVAPPYATTYYPYPPAHAPLHPTGTATAPPLHPNVNESNQQYYEFQWRVLNLCSEFYGAAEELVKATPPLVLAQCYQMAGASNVDPLAMLNEAKRNCDLLLANPSALLAHPPPPMYPQMPIFSAYQPPVPTAASSSSTPAGTATAASPAVITNPQSFVMSLSGTGSTPPSSTATTNRYPTAPYYQYAGNYQPAATYYSTSTPGSSTIANPSLSAGAGGGPATGGNSGAWSEEETQRLKTLANESKSMGSTGDIEWDWVINQWGPTRTRHQILIKATSIGLKESSGRGVKRRRETETGLDAPRQTSSPTPASAPGTSIMIMNTASDTASAAPAAKSPVRSQPPSQPASAQASPAMQHLQPPPSSQTPGQTSSHGNMPWPMPTVASSTSPVITATTITQSQVTTQSQEPQRTSYYRPRPSQAVAGGASSSKPPSSSHTGSGVTHQFMYQPNGGQRN